MCYLVTIGTRESRASVEALLGDDRLLAVRPSNNSSLRSVFPQSDQLFELTSGYCSCALVIQSTPRSVEEQRARLRTRYRRRRWSQAKIARALAEWEAAHERRLGTQAAPKTQLSAVLRALASKPGGLRVLVHFYSGQFDSEEIRTGGRVSVPVDRFVEAGIIAEDKVAEIVPA
jgi:hypothetical protein